MNRFTLTIAAVACSIYSVSGQPNAPFWNLSGNNNARAASRLGTTHFVPLNLTTNNLTRMRIDPNGKIGVNTVAPVTLFHVKGTSAFGNRATTANASRALTVADDNAVLRILRVHKRFAPAVELLSRETPDGPNLAYWDLYAEPTDASFRVRDRRTAGTGRDRITISSNGNVGIGTSAPDSRLAISSADDLIVLRSTSSYSGTEKGEPVAVQGESVNPGRGVGVIGVGGFRGVEGFVDGEGSTGSVGVYGNGPVGVTGQGYIQQFGIGVSGFGFWGVLGQSGVPAGGVGVLAYGSNNNTGMLAFAEEEYGIRAVTGNSASYAGYFDGDVFTSGTYLGSDSKLKQNVADIGSAMDVINKLQPKTYEYRQEGSFKLMNLPRGKHYGLIAQDVEQVLPNLVKETKFHTAGARPAVPGNPAMRAPDSASDRKAVPHSTQRIKKQNGETLSFKAVNYTELIPVLVKAVQELSKKTEEIEELKMQVAELRALLSKSNNSTFMNVSGAFLEQNVPNPTRGNTLIRYHVAEDAIAVRLNMTNQKGQVVKAVNLAGRGAGQVNLDTAGLPAGVYNYTLWVDGREVDTKQLVISR